MTRDLLAAFRAETPGCELVALIDISARTVLTSDAAVRVAQDHLDRLLDQACGILPHAGEDGSALLADPTGCRVFRRAPGAGAEAMAAVLAPSADPDGVTDAIAAVLARVLSPPAGG